MGNAAEANADARSTEPEKNPMYAPPPAYTPYETGAGASSSSTVTPPEAQTPQAPINMSTSVSPYHVFPPRLQVYYQGWKLASRTAHLGDNSNHRLYAFSIYAGFTGRGPGIHCTILHNGPSDKDPALAVASEEKNWTLASRTSIISLPLLNTPATGAGASRGGAHSVTEIMRGETSCGESSMFFRFSIEVGRPKDESGGNGLQREHFEWRPMSSDEVDDFKSGFKLFRMGPGTYSHTGCGLCSSSGVFHGPNGENGNDAEVVASTVFKWALNWNKPVTIDFLGSGLTGELGDRWAVMAIITAMKLWALNTQGRTK